MEVQTTASKEHQNLIRNWVVAYTDRLYSYAYYKINDKELSEDLVQDTFVVAVESIGKFQHKAEPYTWLMGILKIKIASYFRQAYKKSEAISNPTDPSLSYFFDNEGSWIADQAPQAWNDETTNLLDDASFNAVMAGCRKKLPPKWDAILQLKFMHQKKSEIVCQELEITTTNLWQMMHRAKLQLRKCLETNWFGRL